MIGSVLNARYRILGKLGEGGMGEVYLAEHTNLGRKEALKILQPSMAADPLFVSRFRREARAANRAQHPNIVGVYDFGQLPDGRFYLAMEHVRGERLDAVLKRSGPMPVPRALGILGQIAEAVDHAHSRGVLHRDLKPTNLILVEHRGQPDFVKILDFGIAKIISPEYAESIGLTRQGEIFGTPEYMAPELCHGIGTDPRTDIYAIGCIAFELVVGEPPFRGAPLDLLHAHATAAPDRPSARRPDRRVPAALDAVILTCLEKEPARRYASGRELRAALAEVPGFPGKAPGASPRTRSRRGLQALVDVPPAEALTGEVAIIEPIDEARTTPIHVDEARAQYQEVMHELAEVLLDLGQDDLQLVIGVANVQELLDDLTRNDAEMVDLEKRASDLEQAARDREAALRFSLGELVFERSQAESRGARPGDDMALRIVELERRLERLAKDSAREDTAATDRAIALAAAKADLEERIAALYRALDPIVVDAASRRAQDPRVARLATRLTTARRILIGTGG